MNWTEHMKRLGDWLVADGWKILLIVVLMLVGVRMAALVSRRFFERFSKGLDLESRKRTDTLSAVLAGVIMVAVLVVGVIMILSVMHIPVAPIIASAGIVGIAVGFGGQQLVRDVINGFFILFDDQIRVGDVVEIAGRSGLVERLNLRMTVLRDLAGNVHFVRNGEIATVTNMTKDYSFYVFDINVAYRENVDQVIEVIKQVDEQMRSESEWKDDILAPLEVFGLDRFADSAVIVKARTKTRPIRQWAVGREFNRRLKQRFDELDIEIPFPHMTLYPGRLKDNSAPPLNVRNVDSR